MTLAVSSTLKSATTREEHHFRLVVGELPGQQLSLSPVEQPGDAGPLLRGGCPPWILQVFFVDLAGFRVAGGWG
jgi:hypothetical protein